MRSLDHHIVIDNGIFVMSGTNDNYSYRRYVALHVSIEIWN
jgi:hypothetical protein